MKRLLLPALLAASLTFCGINAVAAQDCATECGDANGDGGIDISDAVFLIAFIFNGGEAPPTHEYYHNLGDANGDAIVDISDAVYIIARIFSGGPEPHCYRYSERRPV